MSSEESIKSLGWLCLLIILAISFISLKEWYDYYFIQQPKYDKIMSQLAPYKCQEQQYNENISLDNTFFQECIDWNYIHNNPTKDDINLIVSHCEMVAMNTITKNFPTGEFVDGKIQCEGGSVTNKWVCQKPLCTPYEYCITGDYRSYYCSEMNSCADNINSYNYVYGQDSCQFCIDKGCCHIEQSYEIQKDFTLEELGIK